MKLVRFATLALALTGALASASSGQPTVSPDSFAAWKARLSNHGRWGENDRLGTLNLITSDKRSAAARSVEEGVSVQLTAPAAPRDIPELVTRGVLVDLPRLRRLDFLAPGTPITSADIEEWEGVTGVRIQPGDLVLIRTGTAKLQRSSDGQSAGPDPMLADWLRSRGVAALGSDGVNERLPSLVSGVASPLHVLAADALDLPLLDRLDLESLASEAAARGRATFLFMTPGANAGARLKAVAVF
jgi:hypothetical protein